MGAEIRNNSFQLKFIFEKGFVYVIYLKSQLHTILDVVGYAWRPR